MSIATSNRVWTQSTHSGSALLILLALADRADDDGYCWPGMTDIATRARLDERQTRRIIKQIEATGELHIQRFGGRGRNNEYLVTVGQSADDIARTLVRRFEMSMSAAAATADAIVTKGDIHVKKGVHRPPFPPDKKGDIFVQKGGVHVKKGTLNGDIHVKKGTSEALKGGAETPPIIINPGEEEDISSPLPDDSLPVAATHTDTWAQVLKELALSMPGPTYEAWLRDTDALAYTDGEFIVGVPHAYARDWLHNRLRPQIRRTLSRMLQRSVEVTFQIRPRPQETHP